MSKATTAKDPVASSIEQVVRQEWGRILASLTKSLGDLQLAEDSLQDGLESALIHWKRNGVPDVPAAWLLKTARRKAIDRLRRARNFTSKQPDIAYLIELDNKAEPETEMEAIPDKRLEMIFSCCHPAIEEKSRIALTLRTLGGLTTEEIATAFLDKTETMAARLTRAKRKIALAGIPYEIPQPEALPQRLRSVLTVLYLIFNEGYAASLGDGAIRQALSDEAIHLTRIVHGLMPDEPEVQGLLALLLLHDSRRAARLDEGGEIIPLEHQARNSWDQDKINEGRALLKSALARGNAGSFQLQAAISACHADAENWHSTDWEQISALYDMLYQLEPSDIVRLNHAYAVSMAIDPDTALQMLGELEEPLSRYQPFHTVKADLHFRLGNLEAARLAMQEAIRLTTNQTQRKFLAEKLLKMS